MSAKTADMWKRLFSLFATIMELVVADKRSAEEVADVLQVIKDKKDFAERFGLRMAYATEAQLAKWARLYNEEFGITLNVSEIKVPEHKEGFDRLIIVAEGLTPEKIFQAMNKKMPAEENLDNLNEAESVRKADKAYAVWARDRVEADEELKNKSANDLKSEGTNCITLEERLLLEMMYFQETGEHLDVQNVTLCVGSRYADGSVLFVHWCGWVNVGKCSPDDPAFGDMSWYTGRKSACSRLRSRVVVS